MRNSSFGALVGLVVIGLQQSPTAEVEGLNYGWASPMTFIVIDSATLETTGPDANSQVSTEVKFTMRFQEFEPGTNVLSWARAEFLRINEIKPGHEHFHQLTQPLAKLWESMPPVLIDASGTPVGLVDLDSSIRGIDRFREQINPGQSFQTNERQVQAMTSSLGQQAFLQTVSKIWMAWVGAWAWDLEVEAIRELLTARQPGLVEMEVEVPFIEGGEPIPAFLGYGFLGDETNGLVRLSFRSEFPLSKATGRSMGNLISSLAVGDAKIDPAEIELMEAGKMTELESVIDPSTLMPTWVRSIEISETKDETGQIYTRRETHEYRFNFKLTTDDLLPSARLTRDTIATTSLDYEGVDFAGRFWAGLFVGLVAISAFAVMIIWLLRRLRLMRLGARRGETDASN